MLSVPSLWFSGYASNYTSPEPVCRIIFCGEYLRRRSNTGSCIPFWIVRTDLSPTPEWLWTVPACLWHDLHGFQAELSKGAWTKRTIHSFKGGARNSANLRAGIGQGG